MAVLSGHLPGKLPGRFTGIVNIPSNVRLGLFDDMPGDLPGSFNGYPATAYTVSGVGWEFAVRDGVQFSLLSLVPHYESVSFMPSLNDVGSGEIVIDLSDDIFVNKNAQGGPGTDILAKDNLWEAYYNGSLVFQWFGETVDVMEVDASSESQTVTISGPGTGTMLQWAKVLPPGFPNVIYKLGAITDQFNTKTLNTTLWNTTLSSDVTGGWVGTDGSGNAFILPRALTSGAPYIGSSPYNAVSSYVSVKVMPLGQDTNPANLAVNGSFILGTQGWDSNSSAVQNSGANISLQTNDSEDGDNASCLVITNTASANQGVEQTITNLQPRTTYQLNGWVKNYSGTPNVTLKVRDTTNGINGTTMSVGAPSTWTPISVTVTTGNTANVTLVYSFNSGSVGVNAHFAVDNVQVYRVDPNCTTQVSFKDTNNPTTNWAAMTLNWGNQFIGQVSNGGTVTSVVLGYYDPVAHAYWRVRESAGLIYFDASPDNNTWQQLAGISHTWTPSSVELDFSAWQTTLNSSVNNALFSSLNGGNSLAIEQTYVNVPNVGGVFLDLLTQAQTRGTAAIITPTFSISADSAGVAWDDTVSMQIANGGDLLSQLNASCAAVSADWRMRPGFYLDVGLPGSLGTDLSSSVVFYESGQIVTHEHIRTRDSISNYIVAADGSGTIVLTSDSGSISTWNQREAYIETSSATTTDTLNQIAAATLAEFKSELSQRTVTIPPALTGMTPFVDFNVGDWIGLQQVDLQTITSVRVIAIAVSIDSDENVTIELTLETRIQLFVEQMNNLVQKIAASVKATAIPSPGAVGQTVVNNITNNGATTYAQVIGDGTSTSYTIPHTFNSRNLTVTVQQNGSPWSVLQQVFSTPAANQYTVSFPSVSQVTVTFSAAVAANAYVVLIAA